MYLGPDPRTYATRQCRVLMCSPASGGVGHAVELVRHAALGLAFFVLLVEPAHLRQLALGPPGILLRRKAWAPAPAAGLRCHPLSCATEACRHRLGRWHWHTCPCTAIGEPTEEAPATEGRRGDRLALPLYRSSSYSCTCRLALVAMVKISPGAVVRVQWRVCVCAVLCCDVLRCEERDGVYENSRLIPGIEWSLFSTWRSRASSEFNALGVRPHRLSEQV